MTATASDFRFTSVKDLDDLGGPASRFQHNVAAIKLLKALEADSRAPGRLTPGTITAANVIQSPALSVFIKYSDYSLGAQAKNRAPSLWV